MRFLYTTRFYPRHLEYDLLLDGQGVGPDEGETYGWKHSASDCRTADHCGNARQRVLVFLAEGEKRRAAAHLTKRQDMVVWWNRRKRSGSCHVRLKRRLGSQPEALPPAWRNVGARFKEMGRGGPG